MKKIIEFIKTTTLGGLVVIVPVGAVIYVLSLVLVQAEHFTRLLAERLKLDELNLPIDDLVTRTTVVLLAAVVQIVAVCFLAGLVVRTRVGRALGGWARQNIASRIPMYDMLSNLTKRLAGMQVEQFQTVEIDMHGSEARVLGFLVEELPDGRCTVFVPASPVPTVGQVCVVPRSALTVLPARLAATVNALSQWGVETTALYGPAEPPAPPEPRPLPEDTP